MNEIARNFGKMAQFNYYSSEKAARSDGKTAIVVLRRSLVALKGPLSTLGGGVMNSARKFFEADGHWGTQFAKSLL